MSPVATVAPTPITRPPTDTLAPPTLASCLTLLGIQGNDPTTLPFAAHDATAGAENEFQVAVQGEPDDVDLPQYITASSYYANAQRRARTGDLSRQALSHLDTYLYKNTARIWENSWVRFPEELLHPFARTVWHEDLRADKTNYHSTERSDRDRFVVQERGQSLLRLPISYVLKLALADALHAHGDAPSLVHHAGKRLMQHFLNDNSSPETFSFHVVPLRPSLGYGNALAKETAKRFLLTQLLVLYANKQFRLEDTGQRAVLFAAPHPPARLKALNRAISDTFYRELFMSPCLSGWNEGEAKHAYMGLCHEVLSRSQINAVIKLREAGIIQNNLVVLPHTSNTSLANNGTHISLGSQKLTGLLRDRASGFTAAHEKYIGDLIIKITEHFTPLFVGTYSAAPYRMGFADFHPELALGYLPHELDYTHLRMLWRRWKRKARIKVFGHALTPFGPVWLDQLLSRLFRLKGDYVPDIRLLDYLVALMSTEQSPAFDGRLGNSNRLKRDLQTLGVFDTRMSVYHLLKVRAFAQMGFSGFEARYYSLFPSLLHDMAPVVSLQQLLTALAFKLVASGKITHADIPDRPIIESERRQVFFGTAMGIPTFYVRHDSTNTLLQTILARTEGTRSSRRYAGYVRVPIRAYQAALIDWMEAEGADLIEMLEAQPLLADLRARLEAPAEHGAAGRLTKAILQEAKGWSAMQMPADHFNEAAEAYYREDLRRAHLREGLHSVRDDASAPPYGALTPEVQNVLGAVVPNVSAFLKRITPLVLSESASAPDLAKLIHIVVLSIYQDAAVARHT